MRIIGVTGGIGSGKSTVCALLEKLGARVFYADRVAKELQVQDADVRAAIVRAFGEHAYLPDGSLNRVYLAGRIFSSVEDRRVINRIVHPAVATAFKYAVGKARDDRVPLLVKEAALLFETDTSDLDEVIVVTSPEAERIRRVMARDGVGKEAVQMRIDSQLSTEDMLERADRVLVNDGTIAALERTVQSLYEELVT